MELSKDEIEKFMEIAIAEASKGIDMGDGGPFGACIVNLADGKVISSAHNTVIKDNDPTAHAEINAIRKACKALGKYWLEDCAIFSTCEPCPMCLGSIYWARLNKIYVGCLREEAEEIGFSDKFIYEELRKPTNSRQIPVVAGIMRVKCLQIMQKWATSCSKKLY